MAKTEKKLEGGSGVADVGGVGDGTSRFPKPIEVLEVWTVGKFPVRIGPAFVHPNYDIDIVLKALPVDGRMKLRRKPINGKTETTA